LIWDGRSPGRLWALVIIQIKTMHDLVNGLEPYEGTICIAAVGVEGAAAGELPVTPLGIANRITTLLTEPFLVVYINS
jgi:hypothetical protein